LMVGTPISDWDSEVAKIYPKFLFFDSRTL
jgi:hypothetical protein